MALPLDQVRESRVGNKQHSPSALTDVKCVNITVYVVWKHRWRDEREERKRTYTMGRRAELGSRRRTLFVLFVQSGR